MSESLQTGQEFRTTDFGTVRVGKFLGSGAQGEVFEVQTDRVAGAQMVLPLYGDPGAAPSSATGR